MNRIYVDMDGVLCDYYGAHKKITDNNPLIKYPQSLSGFYTSLKPIEYAIESFNELSKNNDVWILTKPSIYNPLCYTEKALWVKDHLGFDAQSKLIISFDKTLLKGDYLIDDMYQTGVSTFDGEQILFGSKGFDNWIKIMEYLSK